MGTVTDTATKLPLLSLRNRKHEKKESFTDRGEKLGVMRGRI